MSLVKAIANSVFGNEEGHKHLYLLYEWVSPCPSLPSLYTAHCTLHLSFGLLSQQQRQQQQETPKLPLTSNGEILSSNARCAEQ